MTKADFIKVCSDRRFWNKITKNSIINYPKIVDKTAFLTSLYEKIDNRTYYPSPPQEYITLNKGHGVLRVIPAFSVEDLCVYYYCAVRLEKYIAINRTPGTYGGFGISGKLRNIEDEEFQRLRESFEIVELEGKRYVFGGLYGYAVSTLNPKAWFAEWGDFNNKIYFNSHEYSNGYVADLDISNFYDSIPIDNLEYKIRKQVSHKCNDEIYLLIHFLRFWNRHINFYRQQGAGLPQDEFGECSRILANFYLQNFDKNISKFCERRGAKYFRYADDQVIFAKSIKDLEEIITKASSLLMREGLNFNQKKVRIMTIKEFKKHYGFQNFLSLTQSKGKPIAITTIEKQINAYFRNRQNMRKGGFSLLRRLWNVLLKTKKKPVNFNIFKKYLLSDDFLLNNYLLDSTDLQKIFDLLSLRERTKMFKILDENIQNCLYSIYLYNIRIFYKLNGKSTKIIDSRIQFQKRYYGFNRNKKTK